MQDEILNQRVTELESKIKKLEEKENGNFDEYSLIALFLDMFNFKKLLETSLAIQKKFIIANNFINSIILFLFLSFIFWQNDILHLNETSAITTLGIIFVVGLFELLGANTSFFRGIFVKDEKTKSFLEKIASMSNIEIEDNLKSVNFSPRYMDYFIQQLEDENKYSPEIVYMILDSQSLRTQNLDLLFSERIIKNLHSSLVIRVLYRKANFLSRQSIINIYNQFNDDVKVVKVLFATQKYSDCLLKTYPEKAELKDFFEKFQTTNGYLDIWLKVFSLKRIAKISTLFTYSLFIIFVFVFITIEYNYSKIPIQSNEFAMFNMLASLILTVLIFLLLVLPTYKLANKKYYNHYIHKITTY